MKVIVLISFVNDIGGAQIRYISLFNQINKKKRDYKLILNHSLFELAINLNLIDKNTDNIIVLKIGKEIILGKKPISNSKNTKQKEKHFPKARKLFNNLLELFKGLIYIYELHRLFLKIKPKYVYGVWVGGMIAWPLKKIHKFKFTYAYMDSGFSSIYSGINKILKNERLPLQNADTIDFLSHNLLHEISIRVKLNPTTKLTVSPCSFKNYENLFPIHPKEDNVVFCARMTQIKNPFLFLESIIIFNKKILNPKGVNFQLLGDGELLEDLIAFKLNHDISNVTFFNQVSNPEVYFQKSKIFVSIQQSNNYPSQSLLEAMACENVIIASDVGETRKLVTENEGVLVNLSATEIADAMLGLLNQPQLIKNLGLKARQKVLQIHSIDRYLTYFYSLEKSN